jgi:hypothetical protein
MVPGILLVLGKLSKATMKREMTKKKPKIQAHREPQEMEEHRAIQEIPCGSLPAKMFIKMRTSIRLEEIISI